LCGNEVLLMNRSRADDSDSTLVERVDASSRSAAFAPHHPARILKEVNSLDRQPQDDAGGQHGGGDAVPDNERGIRASSLG
jgi:hypothetical protein